MLTSTITQCNTNLDFTPLNEWPAALPAIAWRKSLVCGFGRSPDAVVFDTEANPNLLEVVRACHPKLGLAELARLMARIAEHHPAENSENARTAFLQSYGLRDGERFQQTLSAVLATPIAFQNWVDEKALGPRDLSPLLAVTDLSEISSALRALSESACSKSEGVRALELMTELFLMNRPLENLLQLTTESVSTWLARLEQLRRPRALSLDQNWQEAVRRWPWPSQVTGQWARSGDQAGLEVKLRAASSEDLKRKLERLGAITEAWACKS